ncbi:thiamine phosphate synthase [Brevibacillus daliensis]|uniref:thiamine phosphate synthase n=1 Tax=Brevibacillus daliensis TaxID=2892995 RepID=UPI001E35006F|nr:thiamine phosphate synthase [Brevibacillus daliensis]
MKLSRLAKLFQRWQVYFVVGTQDCQNSIPNMMKLVEEALQAGVGCLQWREKGGRTFSHEEKMGTAFQLKDLCQKYQSTFIINDDVELACAVKADGVHVGQQDMQIEEVKKRIPAWMILGMSAGNREEAEIAVQAGVDYLGVGPIYATISKSDAGIAIGPEGLQEIREQVGGYPIVAIGGIKMEDVPVLRAAGADAVAVISAITRASNPTNAVQALRQGFGLATLSKNHRLSNEIKE